MKLYKLTRHDGTTYHGYKYGIIGGSHSKPKINNPQLCSSDVFHAYKNVNLAFLLNPIHANIKNPILWEIEGDIVCEDYGKIGSFNQKVIDKLTLPEWVDSEKENDVRIMFAILCAESVVSLFEKYNINDKSPHKAIQAAKEYLKIKSAAAAAAARAAAYVAYVAYAAVCAVCAAYAARAAARAAACAAAAADAADAACAADAARAAAYAADAACQEIDFCKLADLAVILGMK